MDKWDYIKQISAMSDRYGDKLLDLMEYAHTHNTEDVQYEDAKEFFERLTHMSHKPV